MLELLSRLEGAELALLLMMVIMGLLGGAVGITVRVVAAVQSYREREIAASVVVEMLERGIPTQEITAVLKAMGLDRPPEGLAARRRSRRAQAQQAEG